MSGLFSMDAWSTVWNHKESFLLGLGNTLQTAVCALALAFAIGALLGLMATSGNQILKFVARVYVEFIQNTPLLLQWYVYRCHAVVPKSGQNPGSDFCTTRWPLQA